MKHRSICTILAEMSDLSNMCKLWKAQLWVITCPGQQGIRRTTGFSTTTSWLVGENNYHLFIYIEFYRFITYCWILCPVFWCVLRSACSRQYIVFGVANVFTTLKRSCWKEMFSQVSVLERGGGRYITCIIAQVGYSLPPPTAIKPGHLPPPLPQGHETWAPTPYSHHYSHLGVATKIRW